MLRMLHVACGCFVAIQKPHFGVGTPECAAVMRAHLQPEGRAGQLLSLSFLSDVAQWFQAEVCDLEHCVRAVHLTFLGSAV